MARVGTVCVLLVGLAGAAQAGLPPDYTGGPIDQITVANAGVEFGPGGVGSTLSLDAHPGLTTIYYDAGGGQSFQLEFDLDTFLVHFVGLDGSFENGAFALFYDDPNDPLLAGNVDWYRVAESEEYPGVLVGVGLLHASDGLLVDAGDAGDWPSGPGSTSSIMFMLDPPMPDDYGLPFSGSAMINIAPDERYIPEPITAMLLVGGLLAIRRRM
ncbi:MAG TPA: hypothetical protein VMZ31_06080 [Phycisphaerae bacterium]|nr:hypothetical protein [Phycisphaerae bacterium]